MALDVAAVRKAAAAYPKPASFQPSYGTAGFRAQATLLASTVFRCGLLAAARTILTGGHTGLMITASHNPVQDNGVKMIEPDGGMLPQELEPLATELANAAGEDELIAVLQNNVLSAHLSTASSKPDGQQAEGNDRPGATFTVLVGHDTRPSAPELLQAALDGVRALGVHASDVGAVTTPQLHFLVHLANTPSPQPATQPVNPPLDAYYTQFLAAFRELTKGTEPLPGPLYVDCANGIGGPRLEPLLALLAELGIELQLRNNAAGGSSTSSKEQADGDAEQGVLNHLCGADFVQKERVAPLNFQDAVGQRCCCFDGDADRLVYFTLTPPTATSNSSEQQQGHEQQQGQQQGQVQQLVLADGDRIAVLLAVIVKELLDHLPAAVTEDIQVCCVQTAYANGASTSYLESVLKLPVVMTPTGVKHLHAAAHAADVGVYFEANGHGTVLFSCRLLQRLEQVQSDHAAARELLALSRLINQTVGDAISGLLAVELVLRRKGWGLEQWMSMYTDLPSRQLKVKVPNRYTITTTDAERRCVTPEGMQAAIDAAVARYARGRAFARPSGTEDAVRVYAEAESQAQADELAEAVVQVVKDFTRADSA